MKLDIHRLWYGRHPTALLLLPLSALYCGVVRLRRALYRVRILSSYRAQVPVIVVGNLTVGGTGKTPLIAYLAALLRERGLRPGIVVRGYRGRARQWPQAVDAHSDPALVGDEPVLLARRCACPVVAAPRRAEAVRALLARHACDLVLSDDGLQHYALQRDMEILCVDARLGFGNRRCLPAGPLRESVARLHEVNFVVTRDGDQAPLPLKTGQEPFPMSYRPGDVYPLLSTQAPQALAAWRGCRVHAVAGIAHPAGFFDTLRQAGLELVPHPFPDHHAFRAGDLDFDDALPIIMTEKDAVKCFSFATAQHWYLPVTAELPEAFARLFEEQVSSLLKK